eukprot:COSAG04_NODE_881_length_9663_cov_30.524258_7_plen_70_part_00
MTVTIIMTLTILTSTNPRPCACPVVVMMAGLYGWEHDPTKHEAVAECIPAQLQRLFVALQVRADTRTHI